MAADPRRSSDITITRDSGGAVRVVVAGSLDDLGAQRLRAACTYALAEHPTRLELDLVRVTALTSQGAAAVSWCLGAARQGSGGVGVSVATAAGRRALLQSLCHG